jgi:dihydroxyacetone kinase DhaKLM complex PTS-EIIA-like component DhaM
MSSLKSIGRLGEQDCKIQDDEHKIQGQEGTIVQLRAADAKQAATITQLGSAVVQRQNALEFVDARLRQQEAQIQRANDYVEMGKTAAHVVENNQ